MVRSNPLLVLISALFISTSTFAMILPENDLHLEDDIHSLDASIDEALFNKIIDESAKPWFEFAKLHGAKLKVTKKWTSKTVNAYARQSGKTWEIVMFGGLARRAEVTPDGFALVVCHELGHHFAGFPLKGPRWAANEGQSDYWATQVCARKLWHTQYETNAKFRDMAPKVVLDACNSSWKSKEAQDLCYRTAMGGKSLADLLGALGGKKPDWGTKDKNVVTKTRDSHPRAQCRLDTYFAGAVCNVRGDLTLIAGKKHEKGQQSLEAEKISAFHSCAASEGTVLGTRPRCWYAPQIKAVEIDHDHTFGLY